MPVAALLLALLVNPGCMLLGPDRHGLEALHDDGVLLGAWFGAWPSDKLSAYEAFEERTGVSLDLVDVYLDWYTPFDNVSHTLEHIASKGALPIMTWEAQGITTKDILAGTRTLTMRDGESMTLDAYLEAFSAGTCDVAAKTQQPVFVRTLHEMNGNWFAWGITYERGGQRPNSEASYREAWIKIHDAFTDKCGPDLVRFVWAVNHFSVGEGASFMGAYPGDAYVDFVGLDGYNWGDHADWGWQSFEVLFKEVYCAASAASQRPILLAEIASTERGGDKAAWIQDMFHQLDRYPRIRGLVWFNDAKHEVEIQGTMDWPIDSSPAALAAYSTGAQEILEGRKEGHDAGRAAGGVEC